MSRKANGVNHSMRVPVKFKRARVLARLEAQLKSGVKTKKVDGVSMTVDLEDKDVKRINKEISTLKARV